MQVINSIILDLIAIFSHILHFFDFDTENLLCPKEEKDGIVWDWVYASLSSYRPCPEGYIGQYTCRIHVN